MRNASRSAVCLLAVALITGAQLLAPSSAVAQQATGTPAAQVLTGTVTAEALNVRSGPGADYDAVGAVYKNDVLSVSGRNEDASWLHITKNGIDGWVAASHVNLNGDVEVLAVVAPGAISRPTDAATPESEDITIALATPSRDDHLIACTEAGDLTYEDVNQSDEYVGQPVCWTGKVITISEGDDVTVFQAWYFYGDHWEYGDVDSFVVWYRGQLPEGGSVDTEVAVYGIVDKKYEGQDDQGFSVRLPMLKGRYVDLWHAGVPTGTPSAVARPPAEQVETTPTATVPRASAPEVGMPVEVKEYGKQLVAIWERMWDAVGELGRLSGDFADLLGSGTSVSDDWLHSVYTQLGVIRTAHQDLWLMDVPPEMKEIHQGFLDAADDCYLMTDYYESSLVHIGKGDAETAIKDAETVGELMKSCSDKSNRPTQLFVEYAAQFN
jgi:SH3-like domain-containing protein